MNTQKTSPSLFDRPPTMAPTGEIVYPDGYRVLVPQPVKFESFPAARMCMSCLRTYRCAPDCPDRVAMDRDPSATRVMEGPQIAAEVLPAVPRVPVWSAVCIACGVVLATLGLVLNGPVARVVWEAMQR